MNMEQFRQCVKTYVGSQSAVAEDGASVLAMLYSVYSDTNRMDDETIKGDFDELYQAMNGMSLREMDRIIYPVCTLCRDHEKSGFVHGYRLGCDCCKSYSTSNSVTDILRSKRSTSPMMCSKAFLFFIIIIKQEKRKVVPRYDWTPLYAFKINCLEQTSYKENVNHPKPSQQSACQLKHHGKNR